MSILNRIIFLLLLTVCSEASFAQQATAVDSLKKDISAAKTTKEKLEKMDELSRVLMNVNLEESDNYGKQIILLAEESRDRELMIKAYLSNGLRCSYFVSRKEYLDRSVSYYNKALEIAKKEKIPKFIATAQLRLSAVYLAGLEKDKALNYANQGFSVISSLDNDSLKTEAYNTFGDVYLVRNEKILALRNYLNALSIAEDAKNAPLIKNCYLNLSAFYSNIEEYDKAIDYYTLAYKKLDEIKTGNVPYQRVVYLTSIGNLYAAKKNHDIAIGYFERSIAMADSLKFSNLKIPGYVSLLNQYLNMDEPQKALNYFNSSQGQNLKTYLAQFGFAGVTDQAYGVIYTGLNKFDSAKYYFNRASPFFEKGSNETGKMSFYAQLGSLYEKAGENTKGIEYYLKVKDIASRNGLLENIQAAAKHLDTLYNRSGNYQLSRQYTSIYYQYKDSAEKLNKEKELAQVEAADEQHRLEKQEKQRVEAERRSHNIQYMAITIGIALLFVVLVIMGIFKVSEGTIKILGFFAFIMFFEFIILIADNKIHHWTHGEPWKVLAIKIILIAMLLPLHHWLEKKVIKYLTSHNRLTAAGHHLRKVFSRRSSEDFKT